MNPNNQDLVFSPEDVVTFKDGIPGFPDTKKFVIVQDEEHAPFEWLICVEGTPIQFAMINPMIVDDTYNPRISKSQIEGLELSDPNDVLMYTFVTVAPNPADSTVNFMGPILINTRTKDGRQIILENSDYSTKEPILRT